MGYGCKDEPPPRIAELERDGFNEGRVQFVELARVIIEGPTFHFNEANNGVEYHKIEALPQDSSASTLRKSLASCLHIQAIKQVCVFCMSPSFKVQLCVFIFMCSNSLLGWLRVQS